MSYVRSSISDFSLANAYYAAATVTVYTADSFGARTTTLAPLYEAVTGTAQLTNPQTLSSLGKFVRPVYVDRDVVAVVTGTNIETHETGVITTNSFTDYAVDAFTGTGAQTVFILSRACAVASFLDIVVDGARQQPDIAYTVDGGTSLTFTGAPPVGAEIFVVHSATPAPLQPVREGPAGPPGDGGFLTLAEYTGDGATVAFSLGTAEITTAMLAIDGVVQPASSYTLAGNTLTCSEAPPNGAKVDIRAVSDDIAVITSGLITVSTTLHVPAAYATVQAALAFLADTWIASTATVTIQIAAGTHYHTTPVVIDHPCAAQIVIAGAASIAHTLVSQQSVSGAAGAYSVVLNVTSIGDAAAGDYLLIHTGTTGTGDHYAHRGIWRITAIDAPNNRLTVLNTHWGAAYPTNTLTGGTAYRLKTVLKFSNCDGFVVRGATLGRLENVAIAGNATDYWNSASVAATEKGTFGVIVSGETVAQNGKTDHENRYVIAQGGISFGQYVGVSDFDQQGIVCSTGGSIFGRYGAASSNRRRGWYAECGGQIQAKNSVASGNFLDGYIADVAGSIICNLSTASGNGENGVSAVQGGAITATSSVASSNGTHGFHARGGFQNCGSSISTLNGADGINAEYAGVILASSCVVTSNVNDGIEANHAATIRALNCTSSTNGRYGVRASSGGNIDCTTLTAVGNVTAAKSTQGLGIILDGTYEDTDIQGALTVAGAIASASTITATGYLRSSNGAFRAEIATTGIGDLGVTMTGTARLTLKADGTLIPAVTGTQDLGRTATVWHNAYIQRVVLADNASTPVDGMIRFDSATSKFQGRVGGAWVDFH